MNDTIVASELAKVAREMMASDSLIEQVIDQDKMVRSLEGYVDEQTWQLAMDVFYKLSDDFRLSSAQQEAINRLRNCVERGHGMQESEHRNNIFKAAHALGMKLPSSMF